ncbi:protein zwilch homolog isoform X1 [Frieseomelitta varia]|uniref:protein zwilch homolog isoform X1 n=1 Tax=Frieseomelitta varia TaxID=561572 RepID=UPI001CB67C36|nr:protein zwilch homolog isoform X1 [Frieseomelitta varia]
MLELETLRNNLAPSVKIDNISLSYVNRIFPKFKNTPYFILYKKASESINDCTKRTDNDETSQLDLTGSPLKYSFKGEDDFEDSTILVKQNWYEGEEKYLPLSRTEACIALNVCIDFINDSFPPIFALCDSKDHKRSKLLGAIIEGEWFTTIEACTVDNETYETVKNCSSEIFQEHLQLSRACEQDIIVSAFNIFDLFGTKEEIIVKDKNISNFEGSLSVEVDTCSLSSTPTRTSKNIIIAQIATNSNNSPLKELWKQLLLLNQYLNIVENYTKNEDSYNSVPLKFPHDFINPYEEEFVTILNNLNLLLSGDHSFRNTSDTKKHKTNFSNEENTENDMKIHQCIESLSFRYNLDFTDFLWELLIKNSNYFEMTKCIHTVLEEIIINDCLPQVNFTNSTKFAKIITNPHQQKIISHLLSGSLPLEYVIDMGFEKLCKDYISILANIKFGELHDVQQKLKNASYNEFTVNTYRKKLLYLVQIHVCLEFILLIQNNLGCSNDDLRTLFCCAFKQYVSEKSPIQNCCDLHKNKIYTLTLPLPISAINHLNEIPSVRRISLSSQSKLTKLTTIKYYSQLSIFPTNIYPLDDASIISEGYHVINAICSSNKFK